MSKIPTAEEFAEFKLPRGIDWYPEFGEIMIEFTKFHVEAALKTANENAYTYYDKDNNVVIDEESILTAYPLENIK